MITTLFFAVTLASGTGDVCDNDTLLNRPGLLVVVPHPDDEVLGFGGLIWAYEQAHKPVRVMVVTDGDAACGACAFWASAGTSQEPCPSPVLAAYGSARRQETAASLKLLGNPDLDFLGYPDGSITAARESPDQALQRMACVPGAVPVATKLNGVLLRHDLTRRLTELPDDALVATTETDADHPDHAALGELVAELNSALPHPHPVVHGRVHPPASLVGADCAFPAPAAKDCACFERGADRYDSTPALIGSLRAARLRPAEGAQPPPGETGALRFCLAPAAEARKAEAIDHLATQIGDKGRDGREVPAARRGFLDCNGFLNGFVRTTELYQLQDQGPRAP